MHGASNRDIHFVPASIVFFIDAQQLNSFSDNNNIRAEQFCHQWNAKWAEKAHKTLHFHLRNW